MVKFLHSLSKDVIGIAAIVTFIFGVVSVISTWRGWTGWRNLIHISGWISIILSIILSMVWYDLLLLGR